MFNAIFLIQQYKHIVQYKQIYLNILIIKYKILFTIYIGKEYSTFILFSYSLNTNNFLSNHYPLPSCRITKDLQSFFLPKSRSFLLR